MSVCDCMCVLVSKTRGEERQKMLRKGKETAKTSVERAPGPKVESTKMTALEYESRASGTLVT